MNIKLSERDEKIQPTLEQFQKAYKIISEGYEDGLIKQIIMTNRGGKFLRWIDPTTRKIIKTTPQSFKVAGYAGESFDFTKMEEKATTMTDKELWYAMRDAEKAKEAMKSMQSSNQENWYADEASVYRNELKRRSVSKKAGINLSKRDGSK